MQVVEVGMDELAWPSCCCSCASRRFSLREHTEKVVLWTVISVTRYRVISLPIPVCDDCRRRSWFWYVPGALVLGLAFLMMTRSDGHGDSGGTLAGLAMLAGIALIWKGVKTKPLDILGFDPDARMLKLKIRADTVANALLRLPGSTRSDHRAVRKGYLVVLGIVLLPFLLTVVKAMLQHHRN